MSTGLTSICADCLLLATCSVLLALKSRSRPRDRSEEEPSVAGWSSTK